MNTKFSIQFCGTYLHVQLDQGFEICPESMTNLWEALAEASRLYNCRYVYSEGLMPNRRMNMAGAFVSGDLLSQSVAGLKMACYFEGYEADELTEFFKVVARNRGTLVDFFSTREEAYLWLGVRLPDDQKSGNPGIDQVKQFLL